MPLQDPIAIIGIGCNLPGGIQSPDQFWEVLRDGKDAIRQIPNERWDLDFHFNPDPKKPLTQHVRKGGFIEDIDLFDPGFFGITPREAICMDPQQRLLLEVSWRSIEDAGVPIDKIRGQSVGVFVGISSADYSSLLWASSEDYLTPDNEPFILPGNTGCIAANRLSYFLDLKGPSFTVDTACSSSLVAVHLACESLQKGESELAIAGGVQALLHPGIQMSFCKAGLLSPEGRCKSFDSEANGYVRSEGAGVVLLKPLKTALRDGDQIHALIEGTAINSDGRSQGLAAPSQRSQSNCVRKAYESAGLAPNQTQYVEAHGTGTRQGDPIELRALGSVLREGRPNNQPCRIGSVKTNLGHGETAAGITGLIKTVLCLKERKIPASLHFHKPNPSIDFEKLGLKVQTKLESFPNPKSKLIAGVSSFGFGGTNAHAVLSESPKTKNLLINNHDEKVEPPIYFLCISARTTKALEILRKEYVFLLKNNPLLSINDVAASTHLGRSMFPHRLIAIGTNRDELVSQLELQEEPAWNGETSLVSSSTSKSNEPLEKITLGLSGEEGKKKLKKLALEIGKGEKFDWKIFHHPFPHKRVNVPGHPFIKQRYWWNKPENEKSKSSLWLDHIGKTNKKASSVNKERILQFEQLELPGSSEHFHAELNPIEILDLGDHLVRDWVVFPAAGYIALALDLKRERNQESFLSDFVLDTPLRIQDKSSTLQAVLEGGKMSFYSKDLGKKTWLKHGELILKDRGNQRFNNIVLQDKVANSFSDIESISTKSFYESLSTIGLNYGKLYQPIKSLRSRPYQAWVEIERPNSAPDRCLIDGCFQAVAACLDVRETNGQLFLPVGLKNLEFTEWPLPDKFNCNILLHPPQDHNSTIIADLELEKEGKCIGKLVGLKLRRLTRSVLDLLFPKKESSKIKPSLLHSKWSPISIQKDKKPTFNNNQIIVIGPDKSRIENLNCWANVEDLSLNRIPLRAELSQVHTPLILWPRITKENPENLLNILLKVFKSLSNDHQEPILLVLEGDSPTTSSLKAFQRSVMLERPDWKLTTLHLPSELDQHPKPEDWGEIFLASEKFSEISYLNGVLNSPHLEVVENERFQIRTDGTGRLEGLHRKAMPPTELLPGEVEIAVEATGLNFRDVLNSLGLLKDHAASLGIDDQTRLPFGGEAVGKIVDIGPNLSSELIGQRVVAALTIGSLASHVISREELCIPMPPGMSAEEGASFSTAFLTAAYGLEKLAKLEPNQTVLIHSAAGGVGQAAMQIAKRSGAKIFATASAGKQNLIKEQGVEGVFDSRTLDFADQILDCTNGVGVDVVLNSLKGEWVDASFKCLKKGGKFLELGKIDIWSDAQAKEKRPDAKYLPFDLLEVATAEPLKIRSLLLRISKEISTGSLQNIPSKAWHINEFKDAFKHMAQARHIGKVVIKQPIQPEQISIKENATYLITGALGGIGLKLLKWVTSQGAKSLILVGRSFKDPKEDAQRVLKELRGKGVKYTCIAYDLSETKNSTTSQELKRTINLLPNTKPLRGIFHTAGLLRDGLLSTIDEDCIKSTMDPKLQGWKLFESLIKKESDLDFIIGFSSIAALLGSPGQAAYAAANGAIEGYCKRESSSPIRLAIQWGPWSNTGMAKGLESRFEKIGMKMIAPEDAFESLNRLLKRGEGGVISVADNDWQMLASQALPRQKDWFNDLLEKIGPSPSERLWKKLKALPKSQHQLILMQELRERLARVMAAESDSEDLLEASSIDSSESLFNLGLDSLMAVEYAAVVQTELGIRLDLEALADDPTLDALAELGLKQLTPKQGQSHNESLNLEQEAKLDKDWSCPSLNPSLCPGNSIFLTGASGFLGAYLLAGQLKRWEDLNVRCLVRAKTVEIALERIKKNLYFYGLWEPSWERRIKPILGDLSLSRFGLEEEHFKKLSNKIGGILHNGAQLSQMAPYAQLTAANVGGTREILNLATISNPIRLEHVSSVSVFEGAAYRNREIDECDDLNCCEGIHIGYSQTKWVSERLVTQAGRLGLPISIYRPPLIGGHSITGHWHEGDLLQRLLQGCLALGQAPQLAWELDLVPVDYVADSISALAWNKETAGNCFHLQHPRPLMLNDLLTKLISDGAPLQQVPMKEWLQAISEDTNNPLNPLKAFFQQRWGPEQLTYPELNALGVRARPSCKLTISALEKKNIHCPDFEDLIDTWAASLLKSSVAA
ncbi:thioester reductase domain-containing protein [Prochlorococcus sp. MIT 1341]|uniref:thioester reductase domain-containing protein n=1 Tax=Prochlorococcus sp. MIT 1341 TaxID=3096221 RepID=UPI002A759B5A|nr:thioester reductase domain-containing protein [Prochlorococcus sp. MIT 1341]